MKVFKQGMEFRFEIWIQHGWQPAGTMAPPDYCQQHGVQPADGLIGSWDGAYDSNDSQELTDSDARALGEALLRGVAAAKAQEREKPTRWPDNLFHRVEKFADFALEGGFRLGSREVSPARSGCDGGPASKVHGRTSRETSLGCVSPTVALCSHNGSRLVLDFRSSNRPN